MEWNETDSGRDSTDRRRVLKLLGTLGVTGLAGCGGDDDTDTEGGNGNGDGTTMGGTTTEDTDTPTGTEPGETTTEPPDGTPTEPPEETPTEPPEDTPTDTPNQSFGDDPINLLEIEGDSLQAGETTTLSGTLENPYVFAVMNVEVTMNAPADGWTVSPTGTTSVGSIESGGSEDVGWEVTAPEDAEGEFTIEGSVSYESETDSADLSVGVPVVIFTPGDAPQEGLEAYFPLDTDTPVNQVTGTEADVVGDPEPGAAGVLNDAWQFESNGNDTTAAEAIVSEPLPINGEEATVGAWINAPELTDPFSRVYHVDEEGSPDGATNGYNVEFDGTSPNITGQTWSDGDFGFEGDSIGIELETWFFVVTVIEGENVTIYVFDQNGQIDGSPATGAGPRGQSDQAALMMMAGDGRGTPGRMDEVRAYSRALSEAEVEELYLASGGPSA